MRITIFFKSVNDLLCLPIHYNHLVQSFIYKTLDKTLGHFYHEKGYCYGKRRFKLFTFSRILGKKTILPDRREFLFKGKLSLKISSLDSRLLEQCATYLVQQKEFFLGRNRCYLESIEVEMPVSSEGPMLVQALSPITTYSTVMTLKGEKKTYFYNPFEEEFSKKIIENLNRKVQAFWGNQLKSYSLEKAYIRPIKVSTKDLSIINFKGYWIKGWMGIYEINLPDPYFKVAYNAGLGSKNSQGFGMIEVIKDAKNCQIY